MTVELVGQQIRIRVRNPTWFKNFRTQDVGKKGRLQRIAGIHKSTGEWATQSWRLNLMSYESKGEALKDLKMIYEKGAIEKMQYEKAKTLIERWFEKHKKIHLGS